MQMHFSNLMTFHALTETTVPTVNFHVVCFEMPPTKPQTSFSKKEWNKVRRPEIRKKEEERKKERKIILSR